MRRPSKHFLQASVAALLLGLALAGNSAATSSPWVRSSVSTWPFRAAGGSGLSTSGSGTLTVTPASPAAGNAITVAFVLPGPLPSGAAYWVLNVIRSPYISGSGCDAGPRNKVFTQRGAKGLRLTAIFRPAGGAWCRGSYQASAAARANGGNGYSVLATRTFSIKGGTPVRPSSKSCFGCVTITSWAIRFAAAPGQDMGTCVPSGVTEPALGRIIGPNVSDPRRTHVFRWTMQANCPYGLSTSIRVSTGSPPITVQQIRWTFSDGSQKIIGTGGTGYASSCVNYPAGPVSVKVTIHVPRGNYYKGRLVFDQYLGLPDNSCL